MTEWSSKLRSDLVAEDKVLHNFSQSITDCLLSPKNSLSFILCRHATYLQALCSSLIIHDSICLCSRDKGFSMCNPNFPAKYSALQIDYAAKREFNNLHISSQQFGSNSREFTHFVPEFFSLQTLIYQRIRTPKRGLGRNGVLEANLCLQRTFVSLSVNDANRLSQ